MGHLSSQELLFADSCDGWLSSAHILTFTLQCLPWIVGMDMFLAKFETFICANQERCRYHLYGDGPNSQLLQTLVNKVALNSLKELAAMAALSVVTSVFVLSPLSIGVMVGVGVAFWILTTAAKVAQAVFCYLLATKNFDQKTVFHLQVLQRGLNWFSPIEFAAFHALTSAVVIHECGHAFAALVWLERSHPVIEVSPIFGGGRTSFSMNQLSVIGKLFGWHRTEAIISAAGALTTLAFAVSALVGAHFIKKSQPTLSRYLFAAASMSVASEAAYALHALGQKAENKSHDFIFLWTKGIHPLAAFICLIAVPLILKAGLCLGSILYKLSQAGPYQDEAAREPSTC